MVSTTTAHKALAKCERRMVEYDSDGALNLVDLAQPQAGAATTCLPIANFRRFVGALFRSVGTGSVTAFSIVAATDAAGSGAVAVVSHAIGSAPDAVNDTIWLECDAEQIHEVLAGATHVGLQVDLVTATDECVFYFERSEPFFGPRAGLTADYIAA